MHRWKDDKMPTKPAFRDFVYAVVMTLGITAVVLLFAGTLRCQTIPLPVYPQQQMQQPAAAPVPVPQTVDMLATPVSMRALRKMTGLNVKEAGLWHVYARNNASAAVTVQFEDAAMCFPQVHFLTPGEATMLLSRKQQLSWQQVLLQMLKDAVLGAAAFWTPWALAVKPVTDTLETQLQNALPNTTAITAASTTLQPGAKTTLMLVASLVKGVGSGTSYTCTMSAVQATPAPAPPMILRPVVQSVDALPPVSQGVHRAVLQ